MPSFFYDIRSYFGAKFSGRYFSLLLRELARHEPRSFLQIVKNIDSQLIVHQTLKEVRNALKYGGFDADCETTFQIEGRQRRADLAISIGGASRAVFEIKEDDIHGARNGTQLSDYIELARRGALVIHLSRYAPERGDMLRMEEARQRGYPVVSLRYRDIYQALSKAEGPIAQMVCDYLEDIGVTSYREIPTDDYSSLAFGLVKMLGFPHRHGLGKLNSDQAISAFPGMLQTIFGNLEYLGDVVRARNSRLIGTRFTRGFRPHPYLKLDKIAKDLQKDPPDKGCIDELSERYGQFVDSGFVEFYAQGRIRSPNGAKSTQGNGRYLYVGIDFSFDFQRNRKGRLISFSSGGGFFGSDLHPVWHSNRHEKFPTEKQALRSVHDNLRKTQKEALDTLRKIESPYLRALEGFQLPPRP